MASSEALAGREEAKQDIIEDGFEVSFGNYEEHLDGGVGDNFIESLKSFILATNWQKDFSNDVKPEDKFYLVPYDVDLDTVSTVMIFGKPHVIRKDEKYYEKDVMQAQEMQVRR